MTELTLTERRKARETAKVALGLKPPPKRAKEGSLSLTSHQRRVITHILTKPGDDVCSWAHKTWLSKGSDTLQRMLERGLIEIDMQTGKGTVTNLGQAALKLSKMNYMKYARGVVLA